ncbi:nucleotidyltransferase domain-containing protein [Acinetobacter rudis]|uniref:Polymerase nucleotidyl transferase domain-containing protein n=1 Tax=Acinetobacter rudis CIP 110305 TaxID=421052 RepID=S3MV61_9GAMM|nr:nucleotidyltransferase domain-containing protein [Acinetobacter rudis]EPF71422.1 hypothetical protein F945_02451 [Acinetobacter rudis CIP 110305]
MHASIIQKTFKPILAEVIRTCRITFSQELHSIYVYGSVAKGIAKVGISDLDVCVIFNTQTADQERLIVQIQQKLIEKYPILPKIDFDIGYIHDVLLEKNLNYWGAWIKFFCTQIYGDDLSSYFKDVEINLEVIKAINSGYEKEVSQYFYILNNGKRNSLELLNTKKSLIKRIIRLLPLTLKTINASTWPLNLDDTIQQAIVAHPDQTNDLVYLNQQLHSSEQADSILLKNLSDIYYWIDEQIFE